MNKNKFEKGLLALPDSPGCNENMFRERAKANLATLMFGSLWILGIIMFALPFFWNERFHYGLSWVGGLLMLLAIVWASMWGLNRDNLHPPSKSE